MHDADAVVGKSGMQIGDFDLGHMAADAILVAHGASRAGVIREPRVFAQVMAFQAAVIIRRRIAHQRFVRIVAGKTSQSRVARISPTLAGFQTIRLKTHGKRSSDPGHRHIPLGAVARAAKFNVSNGAQTARRENEFVSAIGIFRLHRRNVPRARPMARFAGDAGNHAAQIHPVVRG